MKREPKSQYSMFINVIGRPGGKKGKLELTSGNFIYTKSGAKSTTLNLTYQQLLCVLEKEIEYRAINEKNIKLPKPHSAGDFSINISEYEEFDSPNFLLSSTSAWKRLDGRRIDLGRYQFSHDMADGRKQKKYEWFAQVSVQAALWIIHRYIEKFLVKKKFTSSTDEDVVVSKQDMHSVLSAFVKRLES